MTLLEFNNLLESTGYPVAFRSFPKEEPHEPPFICYITPGTENFAADGIVYHSNQQVQVELYTTDKDTTAEAKLEEALADFYYIKDEGYIDSEKVYMVTYSLII